MKLPTRARYAIRFMLELNHASREGVPVSMSVVAARAGLSRPYLDQLAMALRHASLIRGRSGRHGGYVLSRPAEQILLLEIVEAAIGTLSITECVDDAASCSRSAFCACRGIWVRINDKVRGVLEEYTLADLADHELRHGRPAPDALVHTIKVAPAGATTSRS
jgi:Rrf2 family protein